VQQNRRIRSSDPTARVGGIEGGVRLKPDSAATDHPRKLPTQEEIAMYNATEQFADFNKVNYTNAVKIASFSI